MHDCKSALLFSSKKHQRVDKQSTQSTPTNSVQQPVEVEDEQHPVEVQDDKISEGFFTFVFESTSVKSHENWQDACDLRYQTVYNIAQTDSCIISRNGLR